MDKNFEEEIAFFFGIEDISRVQRLYIEALSAYESGKSIKTVANLLQQAYEEIKNNSNLSFDTESAAKIEFTLIDAHAQDAPFDIIYQIMVDLYESIYKTTSESIKDAAMLRTFLYQYKNRKTKLDSLNQEDMELLKKIAKRSEELLMQRSRYFA